MSVGRAVGWTLGTVMMTDRHNICVYERFLRTNTLSTKEKATRRRFDLNDDKEAMSSSFFCCQIMLEYSQ